MQERNCIAYNVAVKNLQTIAEHPQKVLECYPGYFLTLDNIKGYTPTCPGQWYIGSDAVFLDVEQDDRVKIHEVLDTLDAAQTPEEITQCCRDAGIVAELLREKMMASEGVGAMAD